jgi:hypothetical protein
VDREAPKGSSQRWGRGAAIPVGGFVCEFGDELVEASGVRDNPVGEPEPVGEVGLIGGFWLVDEYLMVWVPTTSSAACDLLVRWWRRWGMIAGS